jgi:hypothetical protein
MFSRTHFQAKMTRTCFILRLLRKILKRRTTRSAESVSSRNSVYVEDEGTVPQERAADLSMYSNKYIFYNRQDKRPFLLFFPNLNLIKFDE